MSESNFKNFNHLKTHTQYSICEGAIKIDDLKDRTKELKIKALGICDTSNLCGAVEFSDKLSKVGTQPIIGTQINFKFEDTIGLLPLFALDENGYKKIIELSSKSYLENDELSDPHVDIKNLFELDSSGISIFSGTVFGLFGKLFDKGKFQEISKLYSNLNKSFNERFYLEIQRHNDHNEKAFEKFNLNQSSNLKIPLIATNEVFYLTKDMHEAHDALICIGNKTYINEKNRIKYSSEHYLKNENLPQVPPISDFLFKISKGKLNLINSIYALEGSLYSKQLGIAGTVDCIAEYNGELAVIDFKSSKKPKPREWVEHYFVQCMAYGCMLYEITGISIKKLVIIMACENGECVVYEETDKAKYIKLLSKYIRKFVNDKLELYGTEK